MVSTVEPSSIISRCSRYRRRGRSHAGGSAIVPQNDFPVFSHTGDVEILISAGGQTNRYLLHKIILAQCSGFFEASMSEEWSRGVAGGAHEGELARIVENANGDEKGNSNGAISEVKKRWRYELDSGRDGQDIPMLVQKDSSQMASLFGSHGTRPPPVGSKPHSSNALFFRSVGNLSLSSTHPTRANATSLNQPDSELLNTYNNLFLVFYNYAPLISPTSIAMAYLESKALLSLADLYDALPVVGPRIDHHLLQFQSHLWRQIAKYPSSYLRLGYLAQSRHIFQEALVHVVGQWPTGEQHIRQQLPRCVLEVIEDKVAELQERVVRVESQLFRLGLLTSRGERVTAQNSYLDFLVLSFFRAWLADSTAPPLGVRDREPGGGAQQQERRGAGRTSQMLALNSHPNSNTPSASTISSTNSSLSSHSYSQSFHICNNPNLWRTMRIIGSSSSSGQTYLTHEECKKFLKHNEALYNRDNLKKFERRLGELRVLARELVTPLMRCSLSGGPAMASTDYLVCVRVDEHDFPWLN